MTEPTVPIRLPVAEEAMAISAAMRQAAVDAAHLPPTLSIGFVWEEDQAGALFIRVQAKSASGEVVWQQPYDGRGHRITGGVGIRLGK